MRTDKKTALTLRKKGQSYSQISAALSIPKSTLSIWLKNITLSQRAQDKIRSRTNTSAIAKLIQRNKAQTVIAQTRYIKIRAQAAIEAKRLLTDPLFLVGTSLYWAEGYKRGAEGSKWKSIDFANSDPEMVGLMTGFLIKFLNIKKEEIRIQIMIHDAKNTESAINFWQKITGIPKKNFIKTCYAISRSSLQKQNKKLQYGTIHLRVNNVNQFFRLIGWIDGLKRKFGINRGVAQLV